MANMSETKVFLFDESKLDKDVNIVKLRHPGTDAVALFSVDNNEICEILTFNEKHRSWFFNESVSSNGNIYIPVKVDPLYFMVNLLSKEKSKVIPLEQLVEDNEVPSMKMLNKILLEVDCSIIADQKGPDDLKAFKYNEEKILKWLQKKCEFVVEALKKSGKVSGTGTVTSSTYVKTETTDDEALLLATAHGIVSEYIGLDLSQRLAKFLNLPEETKVTAAKNKRKSMQDLETPDIKKARPSDTPKAKAKDEKKVKDLAKAASGTKNIMSFFSKK